MTEHAIAVSHLHKSYQKGSTIAVKDISFNVGKGELFGVVGPDGAGKTSLFRMLTTLILPDGGQARVLGFDVFKEYKAIRTTYGYMPGRFSLYSDLTVGENLAFFAALFHTTIAAQYEFIKDIYVQIEPFKDRRAGKLSGGMKQKLALCCALIHRPQILFLDEPTTGVDPVSRREFWAMLKKLSAQQLTIVVSTPYMDEAALCDRIALMQEGEILALDTPANMLDSFPQQLYAVKADKRYPLLQALRSYPDTLNVYAFGEYAHLLLRTGAGFSKVLPYLEGQGLRDLELLEVPPSIEDYFIYLLSR